MLCDDTATLVPSFLNTSSPITNDFMKEYLTIFSDDNQESTRVTPALSIILPSSNSILWITVDLGVPRF